jgi:phosphoadenosine phosphosulfate reductase
VIQTELPGIQTKTERAIETLRLFAPPDGSPYWGAFSGGKDSCVIKELARLAGVPVVWHYSVTTVDPPELVRFIRREHPDVIFDRPKRPMWALVGTEGLPRQRQRWCCRIYKESTGGGRIILGVRAAESDRRAARWRVVSPFKRRDGTLVQMICPVLYWSDADVWDFIRDRGLPYCELYDQGWSRLGCILCPQATPEERRRQLERWPRFARLWQRGARLYWERRKALGRKCEKHWSTPERMFAWWVENKRTKKTEECDGLGLFL